MKILPNFAARKKNVRSLLHARRKVVILRSTNKPIKVRTMDLIKIAEQAFQRENAPEIPEFKAGDTVNVNYRIIEGNKERIQAFKGVVIQIKGHGVTKTFTVRKMSGNVGVERIFPMYSPYIQSLEVLRHGKVRQARIFYFRKLTGKKAKIKEKKM